MNKGAGLYLHFAFALTQVLREPQAVDGIDAGKMSKLFCSLPHQSQPRLEPDSHSSSLPDTAGHSGGAFKYKNGSHLCMGRRRLEFPSARKSGMVDRYECQVPQARGDKPRSLANEDWEKRKLPDSIIRSERATTFLCSLSIIWLSQYPEEETQLSRPSSQMKKNRCQRGPRPPSWQVTKTRLQPGSSKLHKPC